MVIKTPSLEFEILYDFKRIYVLLKGIYSNNRFFYETIKITNGGIVKDKLVIYSLEPENKILNKYSDNFKASKESIDKLLTDLNNLIRNGKREKLFIDNHISTFLTYDLYDISYHINSNYVLNKDININTIIGDLIRSNNKEFLCLTKSN